jgi:hypothetical protein
MSHHAGITTGTNLKDDPSSLPLRAAENEFKNRILRNSDPGANMEIKLLLENTLDSEVGL